MLDTKMSWFTPMLVADSAFDAIARVHVPMMAVLVYNKKNLKWLRSRQKAPSIGPISDVLDAVLHMITHSLLLKGPLTKLFASFPYLNYQELRLPEGGQLASMADLFPQFFFFKKWGVPQPLHRKDAYYAKV